MSTYPSLRAALARHRFDDSSYAGDEIFCHEADDSPQVGLMRGPDCQADWDEWVDHFADAWMTACTIMTVEQLNALPPGSVVNVGGAESGAPGTSWGSGSWHKSRDRDDPWFYWLMGYGEPASEVPLPALLVWSPEWQKP